MEETIEPIGVLLILSFSLILFLIMMLPGIFYLLTLQKALSRCSPHNRLMQPGLVWLMLIPFFNIIWHFFIVINMAGTLQKEYADRGIESEPEPGKSIGLAMCILSACGIVPYVGILTGIGTLVCWIFYWIKIADCSNKLMFQPLETPPAVD